MSRALRFSRMVFIVIGVIFLLSGLVIVGLRVLTDIPSPPLPVRAHWGFLILGTVGLTTAWYSLRSLRRWAWFVLGATYVPWTVMGLISDSRQGLWPLVVGESLGLCAIVVALVASFRPVFRRRNAS
jgi:hypothetical protein